jgi:pectin methylesterase-like acyl-CoA thioesterase
VGNFNSIQAALDDADTNNIPVVVLPPQSGGYTVANTLEIPTDTLLTGLHPDNDEVRIRGDAGVDPVISTKNDGDRSALMDMLVSPDSSEEAFNGDLQNGYIESCQFLGDVTVTSNNSISAGAIVSGNNFTGNNLTFDSGVESTALADGNTRINTLTSNNATEGTNT